ncbi:MAG: DNA-binding response regulator [Bacteroidetes bacterium]|nr:MAG: DNA-binding response regulator [Bacteroidota bacterium]
MVGKLYKILLVEDEKILSDNLKLILESEGFFVEVLENGKEAEEHLEKISQYDVVVLDVMMPYMDGFDVCRKIRSKNKDVPVIFLTARDDVEDKIKGLNIGADDYLTKPFHTKELLLRIQNLLKRTKKTAEEVIIGNCKINFYSYEIICEERNYQLSQREVRILELLYNNAGKVISRDEILDKIWGVEVYPTPRTIDNFIVNLRKIIEPDPKNPRHLISVRGVGYKLVL